MSLIEVNWHPTNRELRNFGRIGIAASVFIAVFLYITNGLTSKGAVVIVVIGFLLFLSSLLSTILTKWIYIGLTLLTIPIGATISFVLLAAFYYLLLTPVGLLFRLLKRDLLHRMFDNDANSYWIAHKSTDTLKRYFNQF